MMSDSFFKIHCFSKFVIGKKLMEVVRGEASFFNGILLKFVLVYAGKKIMIEVGFGVAYIIKFSSILSCLY